MAKFRSKPLVKRFMLEIDPDNEMWVEIRQATLAGEKAREKTLAVMRMRESTFGGTEFIFDNGQLEIAIIDMFHTLSGIGGMYIEDEDGELKPYEPFKFVTENGVTRVAGSESNFISALEKSRLSGEYILEIHEHILEVNPSFDPKKLS